MAVYKDKKTKSWYTQIYYKDHNGIPRQKKKRGFKTKKQAQEFERQFLEQHNGSLSMSLACFIELYLEDMRYRWKPTTLSNRKSKINTWILPLLGDKAMNEITVIDIRKWQNKMLEAGLSPTTINKSHSVLSAIFNYAQKFYGLKDNPCRKAGNTGSSKRETCDFWTLEEYKLFRECVDNLSYRVAFDILYYTGLRIGELLALTPADIDFSIPKISVTKNYQIVDGKELILTPKTKKSIREVWLPEKVALELKNFMKSIYGLQKDERIFTHHKSSYGNELRKICDKNGLKRIRIHDLRHSHASLLIELGFSPVLIAERLGHDDISITLNTYSHLYPSKQKELITLLNSIE